MKNRSILILAVILILLSAYLVWFDNPRLKREQEKKEKADLVFSFPEESVEGLELLSPRGHFVIQRSDDHAWTILKPASGKEAAAAYPADTGEVEGLIRQFHDLRYVRSLQETSPDLKSFGLLEPRGKVVLKIKGKGDEILFLGDDAPGGQTFFIRKGSEPNIYTAQSYLRAAFEKDLFALRNRHLLRDLNETSVREVKVRLKESGWQLIRNGDRWVLTGRPDAKIEDSKVSSFFMQLEGLEGEKVLSETSGDIARYGLSRPLASIEVREKDNKSRALLIGQYPEGTSKEPLYAAMGESAGPVFQIKSSFISSIPAIETLVIKPEPQKPAAAPPATPH